MDLKERIILESMKLFSLKGFMSTSVTDILEVAETSKGGFYNYFPSKEHLFFEVLKEAQRIWRDKTLSGLEEIGSPISKITEFLENYRDCYLKDGSNFPGGCIFVTFSVELDDQLPHLCDEVNRGFQGLKRMLNRLLKESQQRGEISHEADIGAIAEMLFAGMLGASVIYGANKSTESLDASINALVQYLEELKPQEKDG